MVLQSAVWVILFLISYLKFGESNYHGRATKRSSNHSRQSWSMPMMRVDEKEVLLNPRLNKYATQRLEEVVWQSDARYVALYNRLATNKVDTLAYKTPLRPKAESYLLDIKLGSPFQQSFSVILDTGSDLTWVQCKPCDPCIKQPRDPFDKGLSKTIGRVACDHPLCLEVKEIEVCDPVREDDFCHYDFNYDEGDRTSGELVHDMLHINNEGKEIEHPFYFGCGYANTGDGVDHDGVLGLYKFELSMSAQLSDLFPNKFAHCLVPRFDGYTSTFTIGAAPTSGISYTPMVNEPGHQNPYYFVQVTGITVGDGALAIDPAVFDFDPKGRGGVMLDTGFEVTFLTRVAFDAVVKAYHDQVQLPIVAVDRGKLELPFCFDTTTNSAPVLPALTFHMPSVDLKVLGEQAFERYEGALCLMINLWQRTS